MKLNASSSPQNVAGGVTKNATKSRESVHSDENAPVRRQRIKKETRAQMLERLSNPEISLHEAGVLLGVCAATVRRLSDSGILAHERTSGRQRRFRLRDVLALLEEREAQQRPASRTRPRNRQRPGSRPLSSARPTGVARSPARDPRELLASTRARAQAALAQAQTVRARQIQASSAENSRPPALSPSRVLLSRLATARRDGTRDKNED